MILSGTELKKKGPNSGMTTKINAYSTIRPHFTKIKQFQALIYYNGGQKWIKGGRNSTGSFGLKFFIFECFVVFCKQKTSNSSILATKSVKILKCQLIVFQR